MLTSFLDTKFQKNKRVPLGALVDKIRPKEVIPKGTLVVMASGDRRLRVKILDEPAVHRNFSEPLPLNGFATEHKVTANYLLWYLSHDPVAQYLLGNAKGSVFIRVPRRILHAVPVPLPTSVREIKLMPEFSVIKTDNSFSTLISDFYSDYLLNYKNGRFRTAIILAGAICEVILYQLLIEQGVKPSLLKDDRGLGFNKMLDYIRVLKLDEAPGFPIGQLVEIQKSRNHAIHAGLLVNRPREMSADDLEAFNPVIKYFGL